MDKEGQDSTNQIAIRDDVEDDRAELARAKRVKLDKIYLEDLPSCEAYERSYMHRDIVSHVQVTETQFLITVSVDGFIKFWKKNGTGIDFAKSFEAHSGPVEDISVTSSGSELASISKLDKSVKIFDVVNFDMINMMELSFEPGCVEWICKAALSNENLAISDSSSPKIYIFDSRQSSSEPKLILDTSILGHTSPIIRMRYNPVHNIVISIDTSICVKYWVCGDESSYKLAKPQSSIIQFLPCKQRNNTYLRDLPNNLTIHQLTFSKNGEYFVTTSNDRKIRVFNFKTGKLARLFDETMEKCDQLHKEKPTMSHIDFARRKAMERDLESKGSLKFEKAIFDNSGHFLILPSMFGAKIYSLKLRELVRTLGANETNFRPLSLSLFQGLIYERPITRVTIESIESGVSDPTLYCSSFKRNRFYCFSNRFFDDQLQQQEIDSADKQVSSGYDDETSASLKDRDIFNERPTREEALAAI